MMLSLLIAGLIVAWRPLPIGRERRTGARELVDQATLIGLGVASGMNLYAALEWSRRYIHPILAAETQQVLRIARLRGLGDGLRSADGTGATLFRGLARSVDSGAAVGHTIAAHREGLEADHVAEFEARLQRLPIKLLFPLALLMLPGLVVMTAAPALLDVIDRLS